MADFRKLLVWEKAHVMSLDAHRVAGGIRGAKHASLRSQIVRAAMSVPANIVEGSSQESPREFARFLKIALNSTSELEYHLLVAHDIHVVPPSETVRLTDQVIEIRKMLYGLIRRLAVRSAEAAATKAGNS